MPDYVILPDPWSAVRAGQAALSQRLGLMYWASNVQVAGGPGNDMLTSCFLIVNDVQGAHFEIAREAYHDIGS